MDLTLNLKLTIDDMSYEFMLGMWRFHPSGTPIFEGDSGQYFSKEMERKKNLLDHAEQVAVSKRVGWDKK